MSVSYLPDRVWWPVDVEPGESLLGFAARTMTENVLPHLASILREAGQAYRNKTFDVMQGDVDPRALAAILGVGVEEIDRRRGGAEGHGRFTFLGVEMRREDVVTSVRRFSPRALAERPIHRSSWMLRQLPFCSIGWDALVHACGCGAVQGWVMVRDVARCEGCGSPLAKAPAAPIPEDVRPALAVYADLFSERPDLRKAALAALPDDVAALGAGGAVELVMAFASLVDTSLHRSVRRPGTWRDRPLSFSLALAEVMCSMLDGPASRGRTLFGCRLSAVETRQGRLRRIARFLIRKNRGPLPGLVGALLDQTAGSLAAPGQGEEYAIDFIEAEAIIGIGRGVLRRARRAGLLRTRLILRRGEMFPALDRAEVTRMAAVSTTSPGVFGGALHLPNYGVEQMADAGVLRWAEHPFILDYKGIRIVEGERDRLLERLAAASVGLDDEDTIGLSTVLRSIGGREKPYGPIVRALLDGEVPFRFIGGAKLDGRIRVRLRDAATLRALPRTRSSFVAFPVPKAYILMDACSILNLHARNRAAVFALPHRPSRSGNLYFATAVHDVARKRVTSGELAALANSHVATVAAELRSAGLTPIDEFGWHRASAFRALRLQPVPRTSIEHVPTKGALAR